jgi:uncharacterized protein (TIGR02246 family)
MSTGLVGEGAVGEMLGASSTGVEFSGGDFYMAGSASRLGDATTAIRALDAEFERNANAGDAVKLVNGFYGEDAQLLPPGMPKITGREAITEYWKGFLAQGVADTQLSTTEIVVAESGDLAYSVGQFRVQVGGTPMEGKFVVTFRRQPDETLKAVVDMFSSNA